MNTSPLTISKYRVTYKIMEEALLPIFLGDLLKSAVSSALKRTVCLRENRKCEECPAKYCLCIQLFQQDRTRPFVISQYPPMSEYLALGESVEFLPGDDLSFELTFIGKGQEFAPYFLSSLPSISRIIRRRDNPAVPVKFSCLYAVDMKTDNTLKLETLPAYNPFPYSLSDSMEKTAPLKPGSLRIKLQSPTLLKDKGEYIHKHAKEISYGLFMRRLIRRISDLENEWGDGSPDRRSLWDNINEIRLVENGIFVQDWWRIKGKRDIPVNYGGYMGSVVFEGTNLAEYLPYLHFGQHIHVGSNCLFGLGKYELKY